MRWKIIYCLFINIKILQEVSLKFGNGTLFLKTMLIAEQCWSICKKSTEYYERQHGSSWITTSEKSGEADLIEIILLQK